MKSNDLNVGIISLLGSELPALTEFKGHRLTPSAVTRTLEESYFFRPRIC